MQRFAVLAGAVEGAETVPEPLIGALFSYLLGVRLPGPGTNYLKQELRFLASAPLDTELTARVEITRLRPEKHLVDLRTTCRLPDGTLICDGRALVLARDVG
nr:phosphate acetyltransferase [Frigidibacter sp. ROC022]